MITFKKINEFGFIKIKQIKPFSGWFDDLINWISPPTVVYHSISAEGVETIVPIEQVPPEYIAQPEVHYDFTSWLTNLFSGYSQAQSTNIPIGSNTLILIGGISIAAYLLYKKRGK
jgi:hypothetical protein